MWSVKKCIAIGGMFLLALAVVCITTIVVNQSVQVTYRRDDATTDLRIAGCATLPTEAVRALCTEHAR